MSAKKLGKYIRNKIVKKNYFYNRIKIEKFKI